MSGHDMMHNDSMPMDHGGMDHGGMDHDGMDHNGMDHNGMDHDMMMMMMNGTMHMSMVSFANYRPSRNFLAMLL